MSKLAFFLSSSLSVETYRNWVITRTCLEPSIAVKLIWAWKGSLEIWEKSTSVNLSNSLRGLIWYSKHKSVSSLTFPKSLVRTVSFISRFLRSSFLNSIPAWSFTLSFTLVAMTLRDRSCLTLLPSCLTSTLSISPFVNWQTILILSMSHSVPVNVTIWMVTPFSLAYSPIYL